MKRILALLLSLLLLCGLCACSDTPVDSGDGHADWVYISTDIRKGALSDQGYYHLQNNRILSFADFASGSTVVLCTKVGCTHDSEDCDGFIIGCDAIFFANGQLYYIVGGVLYRRSATGSDLQEVGTLCLSYIQEGKGVKIDQYALLGDFLYYKASITGMTQNDEGAYVTSTVVHCIGRVNVSNGSDEILLENPTEDFSMTNLCAVKENGILFFERAQIKVDREDPGWVEAGRNAAVSLKELNIQTGEVREIFRKTSQECESIRMVFAGKAYYKRLGENDFYALELATGEETPYRTMNMPVWLGGSYMLDRGNRIVICLAANQELPVDEAVPATFSVYAMSETGFVCEAHAAGSNSRSYAFVPCDSLADGLQASDLKQLDLE